MLTFNTGAQETIRRDSKDPYDMDQNLFRVYSYMSTSSFFNVISATGFLMREAGPFTQSGQYSRELAGKVDFRVGSPWGKTALLTGWGVDDLLFKSAYIEYYFTSSYVGIDHRFSQRLDVKALAEDVRAWRIYQNRWGISQNLRPAGSVDFIPKRNWDLQFSSAYSSVRGFHLYDATENGVSISYSRPLRRMFNDSSTPVALHIPFAFQREFNRKLSSIFRARRIKQFRPYAEIINFLEAYTMKICLVATFPPSGRQLNEYAFHIAKELRRQRDVELTILADELTSYDFVTDKSGKQIAVH